MNYVESPDLWIERHTHDRISTVKRYSRFFSKYNVLRDIRKSWDPNDVMYLTGGFKFWPESSFFASLKYNFTLFNVYYAFEKRKKVLMTCCKCIEPFFRLWLFSCIQGSFVKRSFLHFFFRYYQHTPNVPILHLFPQRLPHRYFFVFLSFFLRWNIFFVNMMTIRVVRQ